MRKFTALLLALATVPAMFFGSLCGLSVKVFAQSASSAVSAILIEAETGAVISEKNADEKRAMASTTKIMTAILTIEAGDLDKEFTVDSFAIMVEGTSMGLLKGDRVSRRDLLYGILLPSGNDAANAAAVSVAGSISSFVKMMNEKAEKLGLKDTHFVTPSGLDAEGHYTTARDLAALAAYAMKNETFREIVCCKSKTIEFGNPPYSRTLYNSNKMLSKYEGAIGVKTGFTDAARRCLVSAAERDGVMLIAVTLSDADDWNDHIKMLDHGFSRVKSYTLETGCTAQTAVVGSGRSVGVYAESAKLALTPEDRQKLERRVVLPRMVYGGVEQGQRLGELQFVLNGKIVKTVPLMAGETIEVNGELNLWQKILSVFGIYA
ncbi:MAG: D-alanyl-D-alanine carboxypeptidase [Oscillospiraceae bacterium]|nr:D-alanyl-D-alanine carboxypeptidase [Oscillospiraceae bacterium]